MGFHMHKGQGPLIKWIFIFTKKWSSEAATY